MLYELKTKTDVITDSGNVKTLTKVFLLESEFIFSAIGQLEQHLGSDFQDYQIEVAKLVKFDSLFLSEDPKDFYYKVTTKYEVENDNGSMKVVKDVYLVESNSFRDAEDVIVDRVIGQDDPYETSIIKSEQLNLEEVILLENESEYPQKQDVY